MSAMLTQAARDLENAQLAVARFVNENISTLLAALAGHRVRDERNELRELHAAWQRASVALFHAAQGEPAPIVAPETAAEDVRNALAIITNLHTITPQLVGDGLAYELPVLDKRAIVARLWSAVRKLESSN